LDAGMIDLGQRMLAKELWEQYGARHSLAKPGLSTQEREMEMHKLLSLREEKHGQWKFQKRLEQINIQRLRQVQRGSAQIIKAMREPKPVWSAVMPEHMNPVRLKSAGRMRRPRTKSELIQSRLNDMRDTIAVIQDKKFSGDNYDNHAYESNKASRELFAKHDIYTFKRKGGAWKE